jgi:hypothetical protein
LQCERPNQDVNGQAAGVGRRGQSQKALSGPSLFGAEAQRIKKKASATPGCDHFVSKPASPLQLLRRTRAFLSVHGSIAPFAARVRNLADGPKRRSPSQR